MIKIYKEVIQGSDEWLSLRCGILTASEMKNILTPKTFKTIKNVSESSHFYELLSQRITGYIEPSFIGDDQMRGWEDEIKCRDLYSQHFAPVEQIGFMTNDKWGFTIGYSPDGLVGNDGLIECKSRRQKFQIEALLTNQVPIEHVIQLQTGLMVSEREWVDYLSYCGGMPLFRIRVYPDDEIQKAIIEAAIEFEDEMQRKQHQYQQMTLTQKLIETERTVEMEIVV